LTVEASFESVRLVMEIILKDSDIQTIRRLNAVINGKIGGHTKSENRAKTARRNAIKARRAKKALHAVAA